MKIQTKELPSSPGVYLFKNKQKEIIYVGKAVNLKNRIKSYFQKTPFSGKVSLLVESVTTVTTIRVSSEIEALLLEASLIKKHQPYFNSRLKDDKDYLYIFFTKEDFPRVLTGRKKDIERAGAYFGPFTSSNAARMTLKIARRIFPFRTSCRPNSDKACLSFHLGLCPGVCIGKINKKDYRFLLGKLKRFLNGETKWVIDDLERQMKKQASGLEFEEAAKTKAKIDSIRFTTTRVEEVGRYLSGPQVLESIYEKQLQEFQEALALKQKPERIECYDISNISGSNAVGSLVVLLDGQASKADYRRFRIKTVRGINDPAMIAEVLRRRFRNEWPKPDLIVVDGGRTQLNAALKVLEESGHSIPVIGLAKKQEEIYRSGEKKPLRLSRFSGAILLLQRIRDEAHRFAITYHRYLRSKSFMEGS